MAANYDREGNIQEVQTEQQMEAFRTLADHLKEKIDRTKVERWDRGDIENSLYVLRLVSTDDAAIALNREYIEMLEAVLTSHR